MRKWLSRIGSDWVCLETSWQQGNLMARNKMSDVRSGSAIFAETEKQISGRVERCSTSENLRLKSILIDLKKTC